MRYPAAFERLASCFSRFQGVGRKTAERLVFDMLSRWDTEAIDEFAQALSSLHQGVMTCPECRVHIEKLPCPFCSDEKRNSKMLCVVAHSKEVYAIEATTRFSGMFYVLGSLLSPLDERGVSVMNLPLLKKRVSTGIEEIIFAVDASLEGDTTVSFLRDELEPYSVRMSRLATGVPVGASLDFVDRGTLSRALSGRYQL